MCVVTGASRGIGKAIALSLAQAGCKVSARQAGACRVEAARPRALCLPPPPASAAALLSPSGRAGVLSSPAPPGGGQLCGQRGASGGGGAWLLLTAASSAASQLPRASCTASRLQAAPIRRSRCRHRPAVQVAAHCRELGGEAMIVQGDMSKVGGWGAGWRCQPLLCLPGCLHALRLQLSLGWGVQGAVLLCRAPWGIKGRRAALPPARAQSSCLRAKLKSWGCRAAPP